MKILVNKNNISIFKNIELSFRTGVNLIYGYNNNGKTSLLAYIDLYCDKEFNNCTEYNYSIMIPTNRIERDYNGSYVKWEKIDRYQFKNIKNRSVNQYEIEEGIIKKTDVDYRGHLTNIRGQLFTCESIKDVIKKIVKRVFCIDYDFNNRYSDGVEDIINIFMNIIWLCLIKEEVLRIKDLKMEEIKSLLAKAKVVVLVDEIEAYLHASVIEKFINELQNIFKKTIFIFSTHSALVLSKIKAKSKFELNNSEIKNIECDYYYEDIDKINYISFGTNLYPKEIYNALLYISNVINENEYDREKLRKYIKKINKYSNIRDKYISYISYIEKEILNGHIKTKRKSSSKIKSLQ